MVYTIILFLYAAAGAAICGLLIACCKYTDWFESQVGESLDELRDFKAMLSMIPADRAWLASLVIAIFSLAIGATVMIAWPVLLLILRRMK